MMQGGWALPAAVAPTAAHAFDWLGGEGSEASGRSVLTAALRIDIAGPHDHAWE
jgi:hypothetical protein